MLAVTLPEFGDVDALTLANLPDPQPAAGEVVIKVAAAGVNRADLMQRQGLYPPPKGESEIPGLEVSGTISALGDGVDDWKVGDEVCAVLAGGGYAEQVAVPAGQVLPVPKGVSLIDAAGLPEVACTVWSNIVMTAHLKQGEVFLQHGGSSGIGTMAIQVAHALGATVAVTAGSQEKLDRCRELGAQVLINYKDDDFVEQIKKATDGRGADVILDVIGAKYLERNVNSLAPDGRLVIIGLQGGTKAELNIGALLAKRGSVIATSLRGRDKADKARIVAAVRENVWPLIESGEVQPIIDRTMPLPDVADAHRLLADSTHVGKVLLTI
ncbi:NAD(P)H-quinone oxidoreductase [Yimella sp. cx-573]|nr:NAD(P)H-quinone oxidoreductase [Yimella sp. cx-573]